MEKVLVLFIRSSDYISIAKHNFDRIDCFVEVPILERAALASCSSEATSNGNSGEFHDHRWNHAVFYSRFDEAVHWHVWFNQSSSCFSVNFQNSGESTYINRVFTPIHRLTRAVRRAMVDPE